MTRALDEDDWDWPILTWRGPHPVPDLTKVPRERWEEALRDAHPGVRQQAIQNLGPAHLAEAGMIELELAGERQDARVAVNRPLAWPDRLPTADVPRGGARRPRPPGRQVNFRLDDRNADALERAAASLAMRPSALARLLTMRGLRGLEREQRRAG